jgi:PAS domain S-box-containing protein
MRVEFRRGVKFRYNVARQPFAVIGRVFTMKSMGASESQAVSGQGGLGGGSPYDQFWTMSPDLLCTADLQGHFLQLNPAWERTLGYSIDELTSRPYIDFVHPEDRERTLAEAAHLATGANTVAFRNRYRHKDGSYRQLTWNCVTLLDQQLIYAVARDVTEHRAAEERFRTLVANIPGAVYRCACDCQWTMEYLSDAIESITGYPASDYIANRVRSFAAVIHPDDRAHVEQVVQQGVAAAQPYSIEYRLLHRDGSIRWVYEKGQGIFDDSGALLWLDGVIFDITMQKRAQQELAQRTIELARSNADLEEFAYAASHDLRAPLRAIANLSEWLEDDLGPRLDADNKHNLQLLRSRVQRMQRLVDDLLTYSRATRLPHPVQAVSVSKLLDDVVFMLNPPEGFTIDYAENLPTIHTARAPLEQVLSNLIGNAIKHHDRHDGRIAVKLRDLDQQWEFTVADDGPGIEPEFHERIFRMFHTLKSRDELEGSGMGLALVKKLVEQWGGRVYVHSHRGAVSGPAGRGTSFIFTWPKEQPEPAEGTES